MPQYTFKCRDCGLRTTVTRSMSEASAVVICECDAEMKRDYKSDMPALNLFELKKTSRVDYSDNDFLPTTKDFQRPEDPTGENGMKDWMDRHEPRPGNKNPKWPGRTATQGT